MDSGRFKRACIKAFTVVSACFAASVVLTSAVSMVLGWSMEPGLILSMFVMFSVLWSLTVIRLIVSGSRWALSKPYIVKDLIFMPVYLVVAMLFVVFNFGIDFIAIGLAAGVFLAVFFVMQTIVYLMSKKRTDLMNDALRQYQKEHLGDEQE